MGKGAGDTCLCLFDGFLMGRLSGPDAVSCRPGRSTAAGASLTLHSFAFSVQAATLRTGTAGAPLHTKPSFTIATSYRPLPVEAEEGLLAAVCVEEAGVRTGASLSEV